MRSYKEQLGGSRLAHPGTEEDHKIYAEASLGGKEHLSRSH